MEGGAGHPLGLFQQLDGIAVSRHLELDAIGLPYERRQAAQGLAHLHLPAAASGTHQTVMKLGLSALEIAESFLTGPGSSHSSAKHPLLWLGCSPILSDGHKSLVIAIDIQDGAVPLMDFCAHLETLQLRQIPRDDFPKSPSSSLVTTVQALPHLVLSTIRHG